MIAKNQWRINQLSNASPLISNAELIMGSLKALSIHPHSVLPVGNEINYEKDVKIFPELQASQHLLQQPSDTYISTFPAAKAGSFSARVNNLNKPSKASFEPSPMETFGSHENFAEPEAPT